MSQNVSLSEIENFMEENKPTNYLDDNQISELMVENSKLFLDYAKEQENNNSKDLAPSGYFKKLNAIE